MQFQTFISKKIKYINLVFSYIISICILFIFFSLISILIVGCCNKGERKKTNSTSFDIRNTNLSNRVSSKTEGAEITITFWNTMNIYESQVITEIIDQFQKVHPNLKVKVDNISFYAARAKFEQAAKADFGPDVIRVDRFWLPHFVNLDLLAELPESVIKDELQDMLQLVSETIKVGNKYYGLPQSVDCLALFYNKSHFDNLRLTPPQNYDEFKDIATKLTNAETGKYAFIWNPDAWWFEPFLFGFGGNYFDNQGKICIASDYALKAIHYILDLKNTVKVIPPVNLHSNAYKIMVQSFCSGQISMMINGPWAIKEVLEGKEFKENTDNLKIAELPTGPACRHTPVGVQILAINKNSKYFSDALKFVKYMYSYDVQAKISKANYIIPARKSVFSEPEIKNDPYLKPFISQLQAGASQIVTGYSYRLYEELTPIILKIYNEELDPQLGLKDFEQIWNKECSK